MGHQGLIDQSFTMFSYFAQYLVGSVTSSRVVGLASHRQAVDQSLWVVFTEVGQKLVNKPAYQWPWGVDSRNELRYHLQPIVDLDGANTLMKGLVHVRLVTVVEQERQKPQR